MTNIKKFIIDLGISNFVNDQYIEKVIETRKFCDHGSTLDDCYELFEYFEDDFLNPLEDNSVLKDFLSFWLPLRIKYIANEIESELNYYNTLKRQMLVTPEEYKQFSLLANKNTSVSSLGVYWSSRDETYAQVLPDSENKTETILFSVNYDFDLIDWVGTIESRIDFLNGDIEQEFKLDPNKMVNFKII